LVSVEEYLATVYRPDCEYVDGEVLERDVGELDHSRSMGMLACSLFSRETVWETITLMSVRVQVRHGRIRVPDISVIARSTPKTRIVVTPPLLCVEILSPEDRMVRVQESVRDYVDFGVPCVWIVNPATRQGYVCNADGMFEAKDGVPRVAGTPIAVPLAELG
jgi:Uma2 family endonuclease